MRRLTIVNVAYPAAPVGPDAVGGAEQILVSVERACIAAGHRSIVVALERSQVAGELVPVPRAREGQPLDAALPRLQEATRALLRELLLRTPVDLVHMHGIDFHAYLPPPGPAVLATLHLPLAWYPRTALSPTRPYTYLHCVSETQAADGAGLPLLPPITNGVDVAAFAADRKRCGYALMLARICPEKGVHLALEAAHRADVPLLIGGAVYDYPAHRTYFEAQVRPLLDRRRRFLGPVDVARKRRLLAGARCLLAPSLAAETSSLVAMEAAASGTPVIAFRAGALAEVVENGRTGLLVDDVAGMAAAFSRLGAIDAALCRETAWRRFLQERMTAQYLARYDALVCQAAHRAA